MHRYCGRRAKGARAFQPARISDLVSIQTAQPGKVAPPELSLAAGPAKILTGDIFALTDVLVAPVFGGESGHTRPILKIQDGCNNRCSYCVIPFVRGKSRSLTPAQVVAEIEKLTAAGFQEVVLSGINLGSYGRDLAPRASLLDLVRRILDETPLARLRLSSIEPQDVTQDLVDFVASHARIARHFHIPLQSASDPILAKMHRWYRAAHYARKIELVRESIRATAIGADVIAGFPGETDGEFETTCRFIETSPLNYLHVFSYSPRPGAPAAALPARVPPDVIKERSARLRRLGQDLSLRFRRSCLGQARAALTLREIRPDGRLRALTDNFIDLGCDLEGRDPAPLMNRLLRVRIEGATESDTRGTIVD